MHKRQSVRTSAECSAVFPRRRRGFLSGRIWSVQCASAGIAQLVRSQRNAWVHIAATAAVLTSGFAFRLQAGEWCWLVIAITCVWMAEALNTALELVCDATSPAPNPAIGKAKDVAAGGVLFAACGAAAIGLCILGPHLALLPHL